MNITRHNWGEKVFSLQKDDITRKEVRTMNRNLLSDGYTRVETPTGIHWYNSSGDLWSLEGTAEELEDTYTEFLEEKMDQAVKGATNTFFNMMAEMVDTPSWDLYGADTWMSLESLDTALQQLLDIYRRIYNDEPASKVIPPVAIEETTAKAEAFLKEYEDWNEYPDDDPEVGLMMQGRTELIP